MKNLHVVMVLLKIEFFALDINEFKGCCSGVSLALPRWLLLVLSFRLLIKESLAWSCHIRGLRARLLISLQKDSGCRCSEGKSLGLIVKADYSGQQLLTSTRATASSAGITITNSRYLRI